MYAKLAGHPSTSHAQNKDERALAVQSAMRPLAVKSCITVGTPYNQEIFEHDMF